MLFAALITLGVPACGQVHNSFVGLPHLEKRGHARRLIVDGMPFLILGGELRNSSSSSIEYMKPVWPRLSAMHLNKLLLPIASQRSSLGEQGAPWLPNEFQYRVKRNQYPSGGSCDHKMPVAID